VWEVAGGGSVVQEGGSVEGRHENALQVCETRTEDWQHSTETQVRMESNEECAWQCRQGSNGPVVVGGRCGAVWRRQCGNPYL